MYYDVEWWQLLTSPFYSYILRDKINLSRDKWSKKLKEAKAQEKLDPDEISKCEERLEMLLEIKPKPVVRREFCARRKSCDANCRFHSSVACWMW